MYRFIVLWSPIKKKECIEMRNKITLASNVASSVVCDLLVKWGEG